MIGPPVNLFIPLLKERNVFGTVNIGLFNGQQNPPSARGSHSPAIFGLMIAVPFTCNPMQDSKNL